MLEPLSVISSLPQFIPRREDSSHSHTSNESCDTLAFAKTKEALQALSDEEPLMRGWASHSTNRDESSPTLRLEGRLLQ